MAVPGSTGERDNRTVDLTSRGGAHRMEKGSNRKVNALSFDDPKLPDRLLTVSEEELLQAPFGLVKMSGEGTVLLYNEAEARLSGLTTDETVGRNFFIDVAPCTNNFMVAERYKEDPLDTVVEYVFTYAMEPTEVSLRLIRRGATLFLLVRRN